MVQDTTRHHRCSIRLKGYDYSQAGAYFITIVTRDRACLFGEVVDGEMRLNDVGKLVRDEWLRTRNIHPNVELDAFVVMPNHFHGISIINDSVGAIHESPLQMTMTQRRNMALPKLIGRFKMLSSKRINEMRGTLGVPVWQRNYYEHIIRNLESLNRIREYIANNPLQWMLDRENPDIVRARHAVPQPKDEPWRI